MDRGELIEEIVSRVAAKLAQAESAEPCQQCCPEREKPGLLILTQEHGEPCHAMLESCKLCQDFRTDCALLREYEVDVADYEVVILYQLTNEALGKLAAGICDTPYTKLAARAILSGKRVFVPTEQVELYRYASTAPAPYYAMLQEKLALLTDSGVVVCAQSNLEEIILAGRGGCARAPQADAPCAAAPADPAPCRAKEIRLDKRVVTERDISAASADKVTCIHIGEKTILTALAVDYAKARDIRLTRDP